METEPTTLMTILDILLQVVVYFVVVGGFIFVLSFISSFLKNKTGKGGSTFLDDLNS